MDAAARTGRLYTAAFRYAAWVQSSQRSLRSSARIGRLMTEIGALLGEPELDRRIRARLFQALALCEYARGTGPRPLVLEPWRTTQLDPS